MKTNRIVPSAVASVVLLIAAASGSIAVKASDTLAGGGKQQASASRQAIPLQSTTRGSTRMLYAFGTLSTTSEVSLNAMVTPESEVDLTSITFSTRTTQTEMAQFNGYISLGGAVYPANCTLVTPGNVKLDFNPPIPVRADDQIIVNRAQGGMLGSMDVEIYAHGFVPGGARMDSVSVH